MECKLLRIVDFKLDLEACLPNYSYTKTFSRCMYEPMFQNQSYQQVCKLADAICNDSFFTHANLLFPVQTVALSGVLLAASRFKYITPMQKGHEFNFNGCFHLYKLRFQRREKSQSIGPEEEKAMRERFEKLHWVKKIDERIDHDELAQCITMMTEFYTE